MKPALLTLIFGVIANIAICGCAQSPPPEHATINDAGTDDAGTEAKAVAADVVELTTHLQRRMQLLNRPTAGPRVERALSTQ